MRHLGSLLFIALCLACSWFFVYPEDWPWLRDKVGPAAKLAVNAIPVGTLQFGSNTPLTDYGHWHEPGCRMPATSEVTRASKPTVYHWTDAEGGVHYGDRPPPGMAAIAYTPQMPDRLEYFNLAVEYRGEIDVPRFRNELTPQVTGIFRILGTLLGQQRLRKVNLNIALYPDRGSYLRYAEKVAGRSMSNTGGFYSRGINEAVTYVRPSPQDTMVVARHESTHVIVAGVLGQAPVWLNEGLAEYFSYITIAGMYQQVDHKPDYLRVARRSVQQGYPRNLAMLFALDHEGWRGEQQNNHYAVSWALVYFMMSTDAGKASVAHMLQQLADHYCQPLDSVDAIDNSYPGGVTQLQRDFMRWLDEEEPKKPHYY